MFSEQEKQYLRDVVKSQIEAAKKGEKRALGATPAFLKAGHELVHFLEGLLEKLK